MTATLTTAPRFGVWAPVYGTWGARTHPVEVPDASYRRTRDLIVRAEELGFDSTLVAQHVLHPGGAEHDVLETWSTLAGLAEAPRRLESYDISHTAGQDMVASMVVFADGRPLKRDYRRFQVKTLDHADDLRALEEVLERRFRRYLEGDEHFAPLPDLLLMDGGQLQAEAACHVLERLGLTVPVLGMVKDDRHRTRALVTPQGQELGIQQSPPLFALVGRVQEEVHRFAITYHHEKHTKSALTSRLDGIPGVGDVRKKALLKHFKSVRAIEQAELLQLEAVLPKAAARAVYDHFHKEETP